VTSSDLTALVHLAGFTTGIVLYAMLGVMPLRRSAGESGDKAANRIPLAELVLGLDTSVRRAAETERSRSALAAS
jgi:hypothetical protein